MKKPRDYQLAAYRSLLAHIKDGKRPYVSMSTGSGKAMVCAMLAENALNKGERALILVPSSELVRQNFDEHWAVTKDKSALGIYSSKLGIFQGNKKIVYATYTSFLRKRTRYGSFDWLIIDEAHYLSNDPETSYQKIIRSLLRLNPAMKICGMTATPYRFQQGYLHQDCVKGKATFTGCAYETDISDLIKQGYLSHVESISGDIEIDLDGVKTKANGDYDEKQVGVKFDAIMSDSVKDMRVKFDAYGIKTAIIYASTLDNARHIIAEWGSDNMRLAYGDMPKSERFELVEWIKAGKGERHVVNVGLFVVGFNYPHLDCVVFMTATKSLVKYVQIAGRVIRAAHGKECGYVLDYGTNIERHGAIDQTIAPKNVKKRGDAPKKICLMEGCGYPNLLSAKHCKECGAQFIPSDDESGNYSMRSKAEILAAKQIETYFVDSVTYELAWSRSNSKKMIKQRFYNADSEQVHENYICLEHSGFAGEQAGRLIMSMLKSKKDYWKLGGAGRSVDNMLKLFNEYPGFFKKIVEITIKKDADSKYWHLLKMRFEE